MTTIKPLFKVSRLSHEHCTSPILVDLSYATTTNFMGASVLGYDSNSRHLALLTPKVAKQLCAVQEFLVMNFGCTLLIYDAYRPLRALQQFTAWCDEPELTRG